MIRLARLIVRLSAWLAPAEWRARWREEWLGEIERARSAGTRPFVLARRTLGAPIDALAWRWTSWRRRAAGTGWRGVHGVLADARFAGRLLRRQPAFTAAAWITLALGIGTTTAMFALVYSVLLRPLPLEDENTLVMAYVTKRDVGDSLPFSMPKYQEWRGADVFDDMAALAPSSVTLTGDDSYSRRVAIAGVTPNFFQVVGATAALGRVLNADDAGRPGTPVVISDALWRSQFQADPGVLGRTVDAGHLQLHVVGVMPPGFHRWPREAHAWAPVDDIYGPDILSERGYMLFYGVGRLRSGADRTTTTSQLDAADMGTEERTDGSPSAERAGVRLAPLRGELLPPRVARVLLVLMAAVALTWLVVCANLSSLLLARSAARADELAVRMALGAGRLRVFRQLLVESMALALPGGALGVAAALWFLPFAARALPSSLLTGGVVWIDTPVLGFGLTLVAVTTLAFGLLPALRAARQRMRLTSQRASPGTSHALRTLLALEIAAGVTVLVAAALLVKSIDRIGDVDLGFDASDVVSLRVSLPPDTFGTYSNTTDPIYLSVQQALLERIRAVPGVERATLGGPIFWAGVDPRSSIALDDGRRFLNGEADDRPFAPGLYYVGPGYFLTHGVAVLRGREAGDSDTFAATPSIVINEAAADLYWPSENPVGRRVTFDLAAARRGTGATWYEVVGVVANVRHGGVEIPARAAMYLSVLNHTHRDFDIIVKAGVPGAGLIPLLRTAVRDTDSAIVIYQHDVLASVVGNAHAALTYSSTTLSLFSAFTGLLAAFGVYSVFAYAVTRRRREIGIRIALGAAPSRLARDVGRQAASVLIPGLAVGLVAAMVTARSLESLLYEVTPTDPTVYAGSAIAVAVVALLAAGIPAQRAARVDPVDALRLDG